jgi:hypothetical protein
MKICVRVVLVLHNLYLNQSNMVKTLIYAGAGWDRGFIPYFKRRGYNKFIAYDIMPGIHYYTSDQEGFEKQSCFLEVLQNIHGDYITINANEIYFPRDNLYYYHSTDSEKVDIPDGDLLLNGYQTVSWMRRYEGRIVFQNIGSNCKEPYKYCFIQVHYMNDDLATY